MSSNDDSRNAGGERSPQIRVMLVDDHAVVRRGLADVLAERRDFAVVGEAGTVLEAIAVAGRVEPDVIIMDLRLPDGSGIGSRRACQRRRSTSPGSASP